MLYEIISLKKNVHWILGIIIHNDFNLLGNRSSWLLTLFSLASWPDKTWNANPTFLCCWQNNSWFSLGWAARFTRDRTSERCRRLFACEALLNDLRLNPLLVILFLSLFLQILCLHWKIESLWGLKRCLLLKGRQVWGDILKAVSTLSGLRILEWRETEVLRVSKVSRAFVLLAFLWSLDYQSLKVYPFFLGLSLECNWWL